MSLAFVFPGQGSQSVGMLAELAAGETVVRETFDVASQALGLDLWDLAQNGPEETLNATAYTQPVMLTAGVAIWRAWRKRGGPAPQVMAGHSLGEYTALVCAEALDLTTAVGLVRFRGELMQAAAPEGQGAMAAILGLDDSDVEALCESEAKGRVLEPVNYNAPGQVVIAGHRDAVERAVSGAAERGATKSLKLPVSIPAHSALMRPAATALAERLAAVPFCATLIPVFNVDLGHHGRPEDMRDALVRQLHSPVRWAETIRSMARSGVTQCVELGPGRVLTGLNRRIERRGLQAMTASDPESLEQAIASCWERIDAG